MELGWACGVGKITVALLEDGQEPELMIKMADKIVASLDEAIDYLESKASDPILAESAIDYLESGSPQPEPSEAQKKMDAGVGRNEQIGAAQ